jgi:hypothetical protein
MGCAILSTSPTNVEGIIFQHIKSVKCKQHVRDLNVEEKYRWARTHLTTLTKYCELTYSRNYVHEMTVFCASCS